MTDVWWSGVGLVSAWLLVWLTLQLVSRAELLAQPNDRSSHHTPTPTGGGLALALLALVFLAVVVAPEVELGWYWLLAVGVLAAVGLWDDFAELPARLRFTVQVAAAVVMVWPLLQMAQDQAASGPLFSQWLWWLGATLGLVWFVNLYNFMDGIDGIAGVQCFGFCLAVQLIAGGVPGWSGALLWLLAGASLGFLSFNWPPAKIFMGDVGSLSIGLLLGGLVLLLDLQHSVSIPASLILLSVFWFDASYTLAVRFLTGQTVTQAHRSHLYQRIAQRVGHFYTTLSFLILMMVWLLPLAWYASVLNNADHIWAPWMLVALAVSPVAFLCQRFAAGRVIDYKVDVT